MQKTKSVNYYDSIDRLNQDYGSWVALMVRGSDFSPELNNNFIKKLAKKVAELFVLTTTVFTAFLFFFATYKIIRFLEVYSFETTELAEKEIKKLAQKKKAK